MTSPAEYSDPTADRQDDERQTSVSGLLAIWARRREVGSGLVLRWYDVTTR